MRTPILSSLPLVLGSLLAACGAKPAPSVPVDPNLIVVDDRGVFLGGERLGPPPDDKIWKVEALYVKLRERHEKWKDTHPPSELPGPLTLKLGPAVTCQAALSAFQTAGFAGYPKLTLTQGTTSVEVPCALPALPLPEKDLIPDLGRNAYLTFQPDGQAELRSGQCGGAYDVVPAGSVPATVKEWCGGRGDCLRTLRVACAAGLPMSKVLPALADVRKGSAQMELGPSSSACKPGDGPAADRRATLAAVKMRNLDIDVAPPPRPLPFLPFGKKLPALRLEHGAVTATGGLTSDEVIAAMKPKFEDFTACYVAGQAFNPNLQGRVTAQLEVGKRGAVMSVSDGGSDIPVPAVRECVLAAASTVSFPAKGAYGWVTYPLMMSPK